MRIEVTDIARTFGRQTRAYAEYRIFSSLARFSSVVQEAAVSLTPATRGHTVRCSVVVGFGMGRTVRVTARGRHAYDAINRVADRIGPALRRHTQVALPS
jgi:ribosome-associated translation inhibitor RaiA